MTDAAVAAEQRVGVGMPPARRVAVNHRGRLAAGPWAILQCDGYAAYKKLAGSKSTETSVTLAARRLKSVGSGVSTGSADFALLLPGNCSETDLIKRATKYLVKCLGWRNRREFYDFVICAANAYLFSARQASAAQPFAFFESAVMREPLRQQCKEPFAPEMSCGTLAQT